MFPLIIKVVRLENVDLIYFPHWWINVLKAAKDKKYSQGSFKCYNLNQFTKVNRRVSTIIFQYRIQIVTQLRQLGLWNFIYLFCVMVSIVEITGTTLPTKFLSCMIRAYFKNTKTSHMICHCSLSKHLSHPTSVFSLRYSHNNLDIYHLCVSKLCGDWHVNLMTSYGFIFLLVAYILFIFYLTKIAHEYGQKAIKSN